MLSLSALCQFMPSHFIGLPCGIKYGNSAFSTNSSIPTNQPSPYICSTLWETRHLVLSWLPLECACALWSVWICLVPCRPSHAPTRKTLVVLSQPVQKTVNPIRLLDSCDIKAIWNADRLGACALLQERKNRLVTIHPQKGCHIAVFSSQHIRICHL